MMVGANEREPDADREGAEPAQSARATGSTWAWLPNARRAELLAAALRRRGAADSDG